MVMWCKEYLATIALRPTLFPLLYHHNLDRLFHPWPYLLVCAVPSFSSPSLRSLYPYGLYLLFAPTASCQPYSTNSTYIISLPVLLLRLDSRLAGQIESRDGQLSFMVQSKVCTAWMALRCAMRPFLSKKKHDFEQGEMHSTLVSVSTTLIS